MSAFVEAQQFSAGYLSAVQPPLVRHFDLLAAASDGVARVRLLILTLAVRGRLVPQDLNDEPVEVLLNRIQSHKASLISSGELRLRKPFPAIAEDEKPFRLPPGWAWIRFGDATINRDGERVPVSSSDRERRAKVYDYYGASGVIDKIDGYLFNKTLLLIGEDGANLLNRSTPIAFLAHGKYWVNNHAHVIDTVDPRLLHYLELFVNAISLEPYVTGTAQPKLNQAKLNGIVVPLPPLPEQARIVARVGELMQLCNALEAKDRLVAEQRSRLLSTLLGALTDCRSREELAYHWQRLTDHFDLLLDRPEGVDALEQCVLELAVRGVLVPRNLRDESAHRLAHRIQCSRTARRRVIEPDQAAISETDYVLPDGWHWCSVDQLSADSENAICDGPFGANLKTEHYIDSPGYRVVRLQNIGTGCFRDEHRAYIDRERFARLEKHAVFSGDIVVAGLVDESIRCCVLPDTVGPAIVKADCYRFAVHKFVDAEYVCLYLSSKVAHEFASKHHHGLTLTRIGLGNFRGIPVPLPPRAEQAHIVTRVAELRRLCADLRKRLDACQVVQSRLAEALVEQVAA